MTIATSRYNVIVVTGTRPHDTLDQTPEDTVTTTLQRVLIPKYTRSAMRNKYARNSTAWKRFTVGASRNPHMQWFLRERSGHRCAWCGVPLYGEVQVHHIDYDWVCTGTATATCLRPTPKRPHKKPCVVPDCEACHTHISANFAQCAQRLVYVHAGCNAAINRVHKATGDDAEAMSKDREDVP